MLGKINNGVLTYAPKNLHYIDNDKEVFVTNPSEEFLLEQGYKQIVENEPIERGVCHYEEQGDFIVQVWEEAPTAEDILPEHVEVDHKQQILYEIDQLKAQLQASDYKAIKYAEGWISEEDYREIKYKRQEIRNQINELENEFNALNI